MHVWVHKPIRKPLVIRILYFEMGSIVVAGSYLIIRREKQTMNINNIVVVFFFMERVECIRKYLLKIEICFMYMYLEIYSCNYVSIEYQFNVHIQNGMHPKIAQSKPKLYRYHHKCPLISFFGFIYLTLCVLNVLYSTCAV